jgi:hypothetical protein
MSRAIATTDHQAIRRWIEARNGHPSVVRATESSTPGKAGLLRIDFNKPEDELEEVIWDEFFETFDENQLAFLYQEKTASGRKSRFNKFVSRDSVDTQDTEENSIGASGEGGSSRRSASAMEEEAEEIDEEDALEEDEDMQDDEDDER